MVERPVPNISPVERPKIEFLVRYDGENVEIIQKRPKEIPRFDIMSLLDGVKKHYIQKTLYKTHGNSSHAAEILGFLSPQGFNYWKKKLGVKYVDRPIKLPEHPQIKVKEVSQCVTTESLSLVPKKTK